MSYTFDQVLACTFTLRSIEPGSPGTIQITLQPMETLDKRATIFPFHFSTLGEQFPNLESVQLEGK